MRTLQSLPRTWQRTILCLGICTRAGLIGAATLIPSPEARAIEQTEYMVDQQVLSVDDLTELWADVAFGGIPPLPGAQAYDHPLGLLAVDWYAGGFNKQFLDSLVGTWEGDVPVYTLRVFQDQKTREVVILNADGVEISSQACPMNFPFALRKTTHFNSIQTCTTKINKW